MTDSTRLLLLDKDGTLVYPKSGAKFVNKPWDQAPLPGVVDTLHRYVAEGWFPVILSNQGGVSSGHKSLKSAIDEMQFCLELFPAIQEAFFCPDMNGATCWRIWDTCDEEHCILYDSKHFDGQVYAGKYRKPDPGMIQLALNLHIPEQVLFVGDRLEDQSAAEAAGVRFQWTHEWVG